MKFYFIVFVFSLLPLSHGFTNIGDATVLEDFRRGLDNPEGLGWPLDDHDPCGGHWPHLFCNTQGRITQIQAKSLQLRGILPQSLSMLNRLSVLVLQDNNFTGMLPSLKGMEHLEEVYLDHNNFTAISNDFFDGLSSLKVFTLDSNPSLNGTNGWFLPHGLRGSHELVNLSMISTNLVGTLPDYLGNLTTLRELKLSFNRLSGGIPGSFNGSNVNSFWLNGQDGDGGGLTGTLEIITTMESLRSLWLSGNKFSGTIPQNIGDLANLKELLLNGNKLVGFIPATLADMHLDELDLSDNHFFGRIPKFNATHVSYSSNFFCQPVPEIACALEVMALLDFMSGLQFPIRLADSWTTNNPCEGWLGIICDDAKQGVSVINLPNHGFNGTLSPSIARLGSLKRIILRNNNLTGHVPSSWTSLRYLEVLDLGHTNLSPPWPKFRQDVRVDFPQAPSPAPSFDGQSSNHSKSKRSKLGLIVGASIAALAGLLTISLSVYYCRMNEHNHQASNTTIVANNNTNNASIVAGNLVMSIQNLRNVTNNFAKENELGHGGFGIVYRGELEDGTKIAVKRMEVGVGSNKALEFGAELAFLSSVRHRHLVSLLGYSSEGNERILIYEYMPQGALSRHLFHWKTYNLEPLSWKRRLNIALDVARGMEFLHNLAHESFIHRDLKPSNILLDDEFRAKVSDFGLVKLAPNRGQQSVPTKVVGTFGYLAPEYAVTGKITTKADVFSFGVVLLELLTGLKALDENRPEEQQHLATWFWGIKSDHEVVMAAIDPVLNMREETRESFMRIVELAGHCTASEASQRPDMGHVVSVFAPFVEDWKPRVDEIEEATGTSGIDCSVPLNELVKGWQETDEIAAD